MVCNVDWILSTCLKHSLSWQSLLVMMNSHGFFNSFLRNMMIRFELVTYRLSSVTLNLPDVVSNCNHTNHCCSKFTNPSQSSNITSLLNVCTRNSYALRYRDFGFAKIVGIIFLCAMPVVLCFAYLLCALFSCHHPHHRRINLFEADTRHT